MSFQYRAAVRPDSGAAGSLLAVRSALRPNVVLGERRDRAPSWRSFANVLLLNARDSSLVKGAVSSESGVFYFENLAVGRYLLAATLVGYHKAYSPVFESSPQGSFWVLIMQEEPKNLNEVTVTAKKPLFEQQIDKLVVNVESSITAAGGTALEVLERSPGVTVNRQNNVLSMSGKSGVMVMLNGKLTRLPMDAVIQMLSGMNASTIEKIELITSPSARYDAEGDAGIINIVTKKNLNYGTNGTLSGTLGYGFKEKAAASLGLNHRREKLNLFGDYAYNLNHGWAIYESRRNIQQPEQLVNSGFSITRNTISTNQNAKAGFDYSLSPRTTLGGIVMGYLNDFKMNAPSAAPTYENNLLVRQSDLQITENSQWKHLMFNLNLRHVFPKKQEWSLDVDRLFYKNENPTDYVIDFKDWGQGSQEKQQFRIAKHTPIRMWVMKTDFLQPLTSKGKLEFGLKSSSTQLNNDVLMERLSQSDWRPDPTFTQQYHLHENVSAAYSNLNYQFTPKTSLQAGLRYEYTQTDINTRSGESLVHRRYGNLFPSVFLSRKLSDQHTLTFSYTRRISRPAYTDLAPFVIFGDLNSFYFGNEKLLPTISDGVQANYTLKNQYIFSVRYSFDKNSIVRLFPHIDADHNRFNYYPENINGQRTLSLTSSIPIKFTSWWQSQNNLTGYWQYINTVFQNQPVKRSVINAQLNSSHTYTLPGKFTAELTVFYKSPFLEGFRQIRSFWNVTAGIQKVLPNGKGTIRLNINDIFWTNKFRWNTRVPSLNLNEAGSYRFEPRVVRFTYSRSFGNQKVKAAQRRATGSEEERQRL